MSANRKMFAPLTLHGVDHLPHTFDAGKNGLLARQPKWGAHLADDLERLVALPRRLDHRRRDRPSHAGLRGVLVPPVGYLERLRAICDKYGILLIFDRSLPVSGGWGQPFGAQRSA